jgi:hypothetical protein
VLFPALHPVGALILCVVDPLVYDKECDASLPLEDMLSPDPCTRKLLEDIDRSKCRVWALTNAYRPVRPVPSRLFATGLTIHLAACRTRLEDPEATRPDRRHRLL